jgi:hypothetical protein
MFPVRALSRLYRGLFMAALRQLAAHQAAAVGYALADANLKPEGRNALVKHPWVVYAKTPLGGPAQVLEYLSRYTHRTAIGNERIKAITDQGQVVFTVRADEHGGKRRISLDGQTFIERFMLHVLPKGIKRIRHYGVLANGCKKTQLAQARAALAQPVPQPQALESARAFMARVARIRTHTCPKCKGPLQVVQTLAGAKYLPAPGQPAGERAPMPARGPP